MAAAVEVVVWSCQAQYCVLKPLGTTPCGESTMIWMLSPETPKCAAARTASVASCEFDGFRGAVVAESSQVPASGFAAGGPTEAPPLWVYWVCGVKYVSPLPDAWLKNDDWSAASPDGS